MNKYKIFIITFMIILFTGCTAKDMKKYGGELALNGGGGNPIMAGVGLVVGGTIYGIGTLVDDNNDEVDDNNDEEKNNKENNLNKKESNEN